MFVTQRTPPKEKDSNTSLNKTFDLDPPTAKKQLDFPPLTPEKQAEFPPLIPQLQPVCPSQIAEPPTIDTPKYKNRVAEARACLTKAKLHLGNSRNLKTEIKNEVTSAMERMYQLVKDAENGKRTVNTQLCTDQSPIKHTQENKNDTENKEITHLLSTIEKHSKLVTESNEKMEELKSMIGQQQEFLARNTYAEIATGQKQKLQRPPVLHSVVVTSKNDQDTGEEVLTKIREAVNATEGDISIDNVRKAKDRKIIVSCRTEEERQKVKEKINKRAGDNLKVEEMANKDPLLILKDVLNYNTDEDILRGMRNQNKKLFQGLNKGEDRAEIVYRKKTRNPLMCHVVMKVSPKLWNRATEAEKIKIDMQSIIVEDQSPLVQCSLCLGYGHSRRFCKETTEKCSHCSGSHVKTNCPVWLSRAPPTCCNCTQAKIEQNAHNAFSEDCPIRRKWDALSRQAIAYC